MARVEKSSEGHSAAVSATREVGGCSASSVIVPSEVSTSARRSNSMAATFGLLRCIGSMDNPSGSDAWVL